MYNFSHVKLELIPHRIEGTMPNYVKFDLVVRCDGEAFTSRNIIRLNDLYSVYDVYMEHLKKAMKRCSSQYYAEMERGSKEVAKPTGLSYDPQ